MKTAVLVMAYGSPATIDDVEAYFTDIRGGRPPSPEALAGLKERYEAIGGPAGLTKITELQAAALEQVLQTEAPEQFHVYVGMKHWHPFISQAVKDIVEDELGTIIGLVLAPHYSSGSIGQYEQRIIDARNQSNAQFELKMVHSWYDEPEFVSFVASNIRESLDELAAEQQDDSNTKVFFTAHSLPQRLADGGDPYAQQLAESADLIAREAGLDAWEVAWQSASPTGEPWLGPDINEALTEFARQDGKAALIAPIGFVSDHLEIRYDLDIVAAQTATQAGIRMRRIPSPNDSPRFIRALANVVQRAV